MIGIGAVATAIPFVAGHPTPRYGRLNDVGACKSCGKLMAGPPLVKVTGGCFISIVPVSLVSLAIVLRWRPYGESDKIVTFLSEDFGKLTGIAKGAKRSRRRFPNSLEALARVRMHFRLRPNASLAFLESA